MRLQVEPVHAIRGAVASPRTLRRVEPLRPRRKGPALFLNPADDLAFAREVERSMDEGVAEAAELERRLRSVYPRAVVRPRDLSSEPNVVWYVYRDGHWVASN